MVQAESPTSSLATLATRLRRCMAGGDDLRDRTAAFFPHATSNRGTMPGILIVAIVIILIIIGIAYWLYTRASGESGGEVHATSHDSDANQHD
jgi:hypothetical protein